MKPNPIILALDTVDLDYAISIAKSLKDFVGCFKVGLELLTARGVPEVLAAFARDGLPIFADVKFNDIPNTVAAATAALTSHKIVFFDVHASSGFEGVKAAASRKGNSKLLVVTVLTSLDEAECHDIFGAAPEIRVGQFARMARLAGADGIVCSSLELPLLNQIPEAKGLLKVTPGVRPAWAQTQDQKRTVSPAEAIRMGADFVVIGRPILKPPAGMTSIEAARRVLSEIAEVRNG